MVWTAGLKEKSGCQNEGWMLRDSHQKTPICMKRCRGWSSGGFDQFESCLHIVSALKYYMESVLSSIITKESSSRLKGLESLWIELWGS